jgi:hypothetical protein
MDKHRIFRLVFAFAVGIALAAYVFQRATDPEPAAQRAREEAVVLAARDILRASIPADRAIEIVDPLATNREAGKVYVFQAGDGWQVSGHYRRNAGDRWLPFLLSLNANVELLELTVRDPDPRMRAAADRDSRLTIAD